MKKGFITLCTMALLSLASWAQATSIGYDFDIETRINIWFNTEDKVQSYYTTSGTLDAMSDYKDSFTVNHDLDALSKNLYATYGIYEVSLSVDNPVPGKDPIDLGLSFKLYNGLVGVYFEPIVESVVNEGLYLTADLSHWLWNSNFEAYYLPTNVLECLQYISFEFGYTNKDNAPIPNPEPATLLLSGLGLAGLGYMKRRRNKQQ